MGSKNIYTVAYNDVYDRETTIGGFGSKTRAEAFIEDCKKPFYIGIVLHDYRQEQKYMYVNEYDINEYENRKEKKTKENS